jgi:hypothetical protein
MDYATLLATSATSVMQVDDQVVLVRAGLPKAFSGVLPSISSTGKFGFGTTSALTKLHVNAPWAAAGGAAPTGSLLITDTSATGASLEAGIDANVGAAWIQSRAFNAATFGNLQLNPAGGNVIVGGTSQVATSKFGVAFNGGTANAIGLNDTTSTSGAGFVYMQISGTTIGTISRVGATSAVAYNTASDRRLKENIKNAGPSGDLIDAIQVRSYDWKGCQDSNVPFGLIAQELASVFPSAVKVGDDKQERKVVVAWGIDPSKLVPLLIAECQDLRRRVAALEAGAA